MKSNIRKLRNEKNISQSVLAEVLGKTQQTVSHMEKDRDRIPIESLITMSEYFGVSTDYILGIEPEEKKVIELSSDKKSAQSKVEDFENSLDKADTNKLLYELVLSLLLRFLKEDFEPVSAAGH